MVQTVGNAMIVHIDYQIYAPAWCRRCEPERISSRTIGLRARAIRHHKAACNRASQHNPGRPVPSWYRPAYAASNESSACRSAGCSRCRSGFRPSSHRRCRSRLRAPQPPSRSTRSPARHAWADDRSCSARNHWSQAAWFCTAQPRHSGASLRIRVRVMLAGLVLKALPSSFQIF